MDAVGRIRTLIRTLRGRRARSVLESFSQFQIRLVILQQPSGRDPFVPPAVVQSY